MPHWLKTTQTQSSSVDHLVENGVLSEIMIREFSCFNPLFFWSLGSEEWRLSSGSFAWLLHALWELFHHRCLSSSLLRPLSLKPAVLLLAPLQHICLKGMHTTLNVIYMYMHYTVWLCIMCCCHMLPFFISVVRPQVWVQPLACNLVAHLQLWYRTQLHQRWPSLLLTFQTCLQVSGYRSYMMLS